MKCHSLQSSENWNWNWKYSYNIVNNHLLCSGKNVVRFTVRFQQWRFQSCQITRAGDMRGRAIVSQDNIVVSNKHNCSEFIWAMPGLARVWNHCWVSGQTCCGKQSNNWAMKYETGYIVSLLILRTGMQLDLDVYRPPCFWSWSVIQLGHEYVNTLFSCLENG